MLRRLTMTVTFAIAASAIATTIAACTSTEAFNELPPTAGPAFVLPDSATPIPEAGLTEYCASSECPLGYTTCPNSPFRCDVNLLSDTKNCGACGVACPPRSMNEIYTCVAGRCELACDTESARRDCNGIVDDGCETLINTNDNCGACGLTCPDPAKPCVDQTGSGGFGCGCLGDALACASDDPSGPVPFAPKCRNVRYDDSNCGSCDNACDPAGDGGAAPDFSHYGCFERKCGSLKCDQYFGDCDHDPEDGCESYLWTNANCGGCGKACPADQFCAFQIFGGQVVLGCVCPAGQSYCGSRSEEEAFFGTIGNCYDFTSDIDHCGACDVACPGKNAWIHAAPSCEYGACKMTCAEGWGDCNGNPDDECETHVDSDPKNCGGCGISCDAAVGQACVQGRCVVAPCATDGGLAR